MGAVSCYQHLIGLFLEGSQKITTNEIERVVKMKCVFCSREYPVDQVVCVDCNEYKGLEPITPERQPIMLGSALANVFDLIEQARQAHIELGGCNDPDCNCADTDGDFPLEGEE